MANITHAISTSVEMQAAISALTTLDGLSKWWTTDTTGDTRKGGIIAFRFGSGGLDMSVERVGDSEVIWKCVSGPEEWIGTTIEFRLQKSDDGQTALFFTHRGWADESPFHYHCSMKWASFLLSLKQYLELGEGRPFPDDIQIVDPITKQAA